MHEIVVSAGVQRKLIIMRVADGLRLLMLEVIPKYFAARRSCQLQRFSGHDYNVKKRLFERDLLFDNLHKFRSRSCVLIPLYEHIPYDESYFTKTNTNNNT